jgi:translation elongation factor EF-1alpha
MITIMDNQLTSKFVINYLKYLTKWNKSPSLLSVIDAYENRSNHERWDKELLKSIIDVATFEHIDTQTITNDKVLSMEEVLSELRRRDRDKKLNDIGI